MPYKSIEDRKKWSRDNWKRSLDMHPWVRTIRSIRARCGNRNHHYFKKGIKNFIDTDGIKMLWFRDMAYLLESPSIDRIDSDGNYTLENCRFIELKENKPRKRASHG